MSRIILRGKKWYCDYRDEEGHRIQRPLSENKREAQKIADELEHDRRLGRLGLLPANMTLTLFKERYFEFCHAEKALNTWRRDKRAFQELEQAFPYLNKLPEITPELLERAKVKWKAMGRTPSVISRHTQSIKKAMHTAEEWKYTRKQDWSIVKTPKMAGRLLYYTMEEYESLLRVCRGDWETAARLMGRAGLRSGEVRHLCYEDIDKQKRAIHIRAKPCDMCPECKHRGNWWRPKGWKHTNPKERVVDMPEDLEDHLHALGKGQGWLLRAEVRNPRVYEVYFRRLIKNAGLAGSPHTLRHTYASHLVSNGVSLQVVGELLGHSDPKTTQIYAHLMPHARRNAVDALPKLAANRLFASNLHPPFASKSRSNKTHR